MDKEKTERIEGELTAEELMASSGGGVLPANSSVAALPPVMGTLNSNGTGLPVPGPIL